MHRIIQKRMFNVHREMSILCTSKLLKKKWATLYFSDNTQFVILLHSYMRLKISDGKKRIHSNLNHSNTVCIRQIKITSIHLLRHISWISLKFRHISYQRYESRNNSIQCQFVWKKNQPRHINNHTKRVLPVHLTSKKIDKKKISLAQINGVGNLKLRLYQMYTNISAKKKYKIWYCPIFWRKKFGW